MELNSKNKRSVYRTTIMLVILTVAIVGQADAAWWDASRQYRLPITVSPQGYERYDKPVEVVVNFTEIFAQLGKSGPLDENSIRAIETDNLGEILNPSVLFQFVKDYNYDANVRASGIVTFIMNGVTLSNQNRYFYIYFNLTGGTYSPFSVTPLVTIISDNIMDEGQAAYRISSANSTYYYQKQAGGFSSLNDKSSIDWINFNESITGDGGTFRGIPNAIYPEGYFHPGSTCCTTSLISNGPIKVRIRSSSNDGKWESLWDFYPNYATMTMTKANSNYWFLYEGTPGGVLEPSIDYAYRSNGIKTYLSQSWLGDMIGDEWLYFSDPAIGRSLFIAHHESDSLTDSYKPMGSMTAFGFGRDDVNPLLIQVPQLFTIGFVDGTNFTQNSKKINSAYKNLNVTKGAAEKYSIPEQIIILNVTYNHTKTTKAFSFFGNPTGVPNDLTSPVNYAQGTLYQRLQVLTKPSDKTVKYQICLFQDEIIPEKHACSNENQLSFTVPGTYYANQNMITLYQYNNISWNRSLLDRMLVVKDLNGKPIDDRYGWDGTWDGNPDFNLYYPMKVLYTAIIVPPGGGEPKWPFDIPLEITSSSPINDPNTTVGTSQKFIINLNKKADVSWYIENTNILDYYNTDKSEYTNSTAGAGIYNITVVASSGTETVSRKWKWKVYTPLAITLSAPTTDPVTIEGTSQKFSIDLSKKADVEWYIENTIAKSKEFGVDKSEYTNSTAVNGKYNVSARVSSDTESVSKIWQWVVESPLTITSYSPPSDPTTIEGESQTFSINLNKKADVSWYIDNTNVWFDNNAEFSEYITSSDPGLYNVKAVVDIGSENISRTWIWNVLPKIVYVPPTPIIKETTKGNFWIKYILQPGIGLNDTDSYNISINGIWVNNTIGEINITVGPHGHGNITVYAYNNTGGLSLSPVIQNMQIDNNVPVQQNIGDKTVVVESELTFKVNATDIDSDIITYITNATKGTLNPSTGIYSWTPESTDIGEYIWSFSSKDNFGGIDEEVLKVKVSKKLYIPPAPTNLQNKTGNFWVNYTWQPGENDNVTDSYNVNINGIWYNNTTENFKNVTTGPHGIVNMTVFAYNFSGVDSIRGSNQTTKIPNNPPVMNIGDRTIKAGDLLTFTVATDLDNDTMTFGTNATRGNINQTTGIYSWQTNNIDIGKYVWGFNSSDNYEGKNNITINVTVNQNTNNGGNTGGSGSGGGSSGGGGGGGSSDENYRNIIVKERKDLFIFKDTVTRYLFTDKRNPITFVNITGNTSPGEITTMVEVLIDTSGLVKKPPPKTIYKNINIWVGTYGFATPKNIKTATIAFKVENSWINKNTFKTTNVKMAKWNGNKWIVLDTFEKANDNTFTYYETGVDSFSHFAIIGYKDSQYIEEESANANKNETGETGTKKRPREKPFSSTPSKNLAGLDIVIVMLIFSILVWYDKRNKN